MSNISKDYNKSLKDILKKYDGGNYSTENQPVPWEGFKDFVLVDKVKECDDIISFYFKPKDNKKLVKHIAGQYLPIKLKTDNKKYRDEIRTYSLSMKPNEYIYRISVKKIQGGLISTYLHDELQVGDIIEAMIPAGLFTLNKKKGNNPIVLLAGGIGITPLLSMLYDEVDEGKKIYFVQAVQNSKAQPFNYDIKKIAETSDVKSMVFYDRPLESDAQGNDYDFEGFITRQWLADNVPLNSSFYFCGPPPFMKNLNKCLLSLGVSKESINFEFFGEPQSME